MKTLAVDNPVDTPSHHRQSQSAANLSTPIRYKVCSNGFAYITTPTTSIFQQVVPASMMWFVSISLFQVVQIYLLSFVDTPRKFIIAELSIRKLGSSSVLIIRLFEFTRPFLYIKCRDCMLA